MFGFKAGDKVMIKNNDKYDRGVIVRQFTASTSYLVRVHDGKEFAVDRNDLIKINGSDNNYE